MSRDEIGDQRQSSGPVRGSATDPASDHIRSVPTPTQTGLKIDQYRVQITISAIVFVVVWAYWSSLLHLAGRWLREPEYSHGFFVPVWSVVLLWLRRKQITGMVWEGSWWGLGLVAIGIALRCVAAYGFYTLMAAFSLLPTLAGLAIAAGGWRCLRWALPSIVFLVFMIPLPGFISESLSLPLQHLAVTSVTYLLQLIGIPAGMEGNVILLTHSKVGVVEACSGLRMLILFFAVSTGVAMIVQRTWIERIVLIASAVPIAIAVNIVRITATALLHNWVNPQFGESFFHDLGGWLMGPMALGLLWLEMKFFDRALVVVPSGPLRLSATPRNSDHRS
ncbi:MAG TPA: exosortase/archaeosortase family protein [Pirellulales bacterium]|nr:exosortase/archaeosortase family protein [Pirellulales bacterium]